MKALIDGDIILYRCGFAAQGKIYNLSLPSYLGEIPKFKYKKDMLAWREEYAKGESEYTVTVDTVIEPVENALTNFRDDMATIRVYKGNRDPLHKPHWYDEIKEYLRSVWKAEEEEHLEADDILAKLQSNNTCIVTTDKDLDQVAGWHYNWVKDILYEVSIEQGIHSKYVQILTGDSTDNIEGIPGVGPVSAEKCLEWCSSIDDYEQAIKEEYEHFFTQTKKGVEKSNEYCMTWDQILEETRRLITLGERRNDLKRE